MLSYGDCKELFANITDAETIENTGNPKGLSDRPLDNSVKISNFGMKFINENAK